MGSGCTGGNGRWRPDMVQRLTALARNRTDFDLGVLRLFQTRFADRSEPGISAGSAHPVAICVCLPGMDLVYRKQPLRTIDYRYVVANGLWACHSSTTIDVQYIAPTMIMLVAILVFDEPFGQARAISFPLIWSALLLYSYSSLRDRRG